MVSISDKFQELSSMDSEDEKDHKLVFRLKKNTFHFNTYKTTINFVKYL